MIHDADDDEDVWTGTQAFLPVDALPLFDVILPLFFANGYLDHVFKTEKYMM